MKRFDSLQLAYRLAASVLVLVSACGDGDGAAEPDAGAASDATVPSGDEDAGRDASPPADAALVPDADIDQSDAAFDPGPDASLIGTTPTPGVSHGCPETLSGWFAGFDNGSFGFIPGHTFTAHVTGALTGVGVGVSGQGGSMTVQLRDVVDGEVSEDVLAARTLEAPGFNRGYFYYVDFQDAGVTLQEGTVYAISVLTAGTYMNWYYGTQCLPETVEGEIHYTMNGGRTWTPYGDLGAFDVRILP